MKKFKRIPIPELAHLEINEEGYLLDPSSGQLEIGGSFYIGDKLLDVKDVVQITFGDVYS